MKALVLEHYNDSYSLVDIPKPTVNKGEVPVRIKASGVNPLDLKIKEGRAPHAQTKLPAILGIDMAGIVESVGEGVSGFGSGDEVYGMIGGIAGIPGSLAEYASVDARLLALKPKNQAMREAASLPLIFITAWEALVDSANVGGDKTVLVHGGAGGVGHIAVQLAVARGARVFATVNSSRAELIKSYGATPIDYSQLSVAGYVSRYTEGKGFDIILDTIGGQVLDDSFSAVKRYTGHVVSILGWGTDSLAPLSFRGSKYSGVFTLYPLISGEGRAHHGEILKEATCLVEAGRIIPLVDPGLYTLETIEQAYLSLQRKTAHGKVVITID
jgi:NADPH2:quinone reductase